MNILLWHVHGSWTTSFVHGKHRYLVPVTPDRGPYGLGRARTYPWPDTRRRGQPRSSCAGADVDVVILQRPEELDLAAEWLRPPGRPGPAGDLRRAQHPEGATCRTPATRWPTGTTCCVVHVTHFNELFWDTGATRTTVVEHGIVPPAAPLHRRAGPARRRDQRAGTPRPGHRHRPAAPVRRDRPAGRLRHGGRRAAPTTSGCPPTG